MGFWVMRLGMGWMDWDGIGMLGNGLGFFGTDWDSWELTGMLAPGMDPML